MKKLSPMEDTILNLYADGDSTKQIAAELEISARTVEAHKVHFMAKLGANHICHAVAIYARAGLLK